MVVGVPLLFATLVGIRAGAGVPPPMLAGHGWLAYLAYGVLYLWLPLPHARMVQRRTLNGVVLALLLVCAAAVSHFSGSALGSILMVVVATVLPWYLPLSLGILLLAVSQAGMAPLFVWGQGADWLSAILQSMVYAGFSAFSFVTGLVAKQQSDARDEQRRLNAELHATRALLAESVRLNERTRISRELHDLLGHHLTALSLNLEVASHLVSGEAEIHVRQAHTLAKLLLTDVREAVSQMREAATTLSITDALKPLAENVPGLDVHMQIPDALQVMDAGRAHVLLRAVQEVITNTVRHARATRLDIRLWQDGPLLHLEAHDDGVGSARLQPGNGLRGLDERLREYQGRLAIRSVPGQGFCLNIDLPLAVQACDDMPSSHGASS